MTKSLLSPTEAALTKPYVFRGLKPIRSRLERRNGSTEPKGHRYIYKVKNATTYECRDRLHNRLRSLIALTGQTETFCQKVQNRNQTVELVIEQKLLAAQHAPEEVFEDL
ncbi:MAG: hypothetical protein ACE5KM_22650, partial [Planctomycetaceae bacterium]